MIKIKSKNKIFIIRLVFLLSLILMSGFILLGNNSISPKRYYVEINSVKSSNSEILIIAPENKTYTEPMSGYYPGTYGFENDEIGSNPAGWDTVEENSTIQVISELDNHNNIVEIDDRNSVAGWDGIFQYSRFPKSYGTIEFWVRMNSTSECLQISGRDSIDNEVVLNLKAELGKWRYKASTIDYNVPNVNDPQPYTWHHVRIDFRCHNAPAYLGISNDRFIVTIDGISSGELQQAKSGKLDYQWFKIGTLPTAVMKVWVDAVGFAEDPNYNIGDNLNEGLLLSFDNSTTLDWMGYSLDGQPIKTILGNTTLPLPANGAHYIQVFGNDSLGTTHASNLRYFTLDVPMISIRTPENKTYTGPMSGYYPATYGFENDKNGNNPSSWEIREGGGKCRVIESEASHSKIVELNDISGIDRVYMNQTLIGKPYGTIEFWWRIDDSTKSIGISLFNGDTWVISIVMDNNIFKYWDSGWQDLGISATSDTWYHIRIDFECTTGSYQGLAQYYYDIYIDGTFYGDYNFIFTESQIDLIHFNTNIAYSNYNAYIDAIGYTWDPNYNLGDNFNEGLLLSFNNRTTIDWMGYSLDGQANKTILGDTTIPLPANGAHNIQMFGNDSLGTIYESEVRHFSINTPSPSINIITPSSDDFYSNIAPSFSISITAFYRITTWYTLDNGGKNITFTGSSGTINQTEWDEQGEIPITIRFYVNDSFARLNYDEVTINKDITDPVITINSPSLGDGFTTIPPSFNISVDELNIDVMWYTIDGGVTNYNISQYTGYIDSGAWNTAPDGAITIRFYVRDKAGNIDYEDVIVQKSTPPYIPPDNSLIIIISVAIGVFIAVVALFLIITLVRKRNARPPKLKKLITPVEVKDIYRKCPYCHSETHIKDNYCIYCGASLLEFKPDNM